MRISLGIALERFVKFAKTPKSVIRTAATHVSKKSTEESSLISKCFRMYERLGDLQ
jgi:hypothetical protein